MKKMLLTLAAMLIAVGAMAQVSDNATQVVTYNLVQPFISVVATGVYYYGESYDATTGVTTIAANPGFTVTSNRPWSSTGELDGNVGGAAVLNGWWAPPVGDDDDYPGNNDFFGGYTNLATITPHLAAFELIGQWGPDVDGGAKSVDVIMNVWHVAP